MNAPARAIGTYILDDLGRAVPSDAKTWAAWMEKQNHVLEQTELGEALVSTIFLGLDHNHSGHGPPLLWETRVFGGALDGEQARYSTREQAELGHAAMVDRVRAGSAA